MSSKTIKREKENLSVKSIAHSLFDKTDISTIVFFRVMFGFIMLVEVYRYFEKDWIAKYWIETKYHFPHWPFLSLQPLEGDGMYHLFTLMGILSVLIIVGLFYRLSMILFFLAFTYMFLLEQTRYLNHFYLVVLVSFVMIFIPANTSFSLDAKIFKKNRTEYAPMWCLWLLRFMIGIPFFFGGLAKINPDWLAGQPLSIWLAQDTDFPIIGQFFTEHWMILAMSYAGIFIDLLIVPFLLFKRTRIYAFGVGLLFHLMNAQLFTIGIFPWFMMVSMLLFFNSTWPRKIIFALTGKPLSSIKEVVPNSSALTFRQKTIIGALVFWALLMVLIPLRHFIIPGNVSWTEEGHKYSWHMKLRTKRANGYFVIRDKSGEFRYYINPYENLPDWQSRKVIARPPMIWQFAQILKESYAKNGYDIEVYANIEASLNGRPYQQFTDSTVELSSEPFPIWKADWILPLTTPLPSKKK